MFNQKRIAFTISMLVTVYVTLISLWFVLWLTIGDGNWWLTLLNRIVPHLFAPMPLLLALAILSRCFKPTLVLLVPVLIFGGLYYPYLLPKLVQPKEGGSELSVMTYNVLFSNSDYEAIARVILTYQPDLVALQEVQPPMMAALKEQLAEEYPYSLMGNEHSYGTTAVFSRYPVTDAHVLDLQADRPAVLVRTKVQEREITFIAAHLLAYGLWWVGWEDIPEVVSERTVDQNRQAKVLLEQIRKKEEIVIIGCDCNSYETSSSYRILSHVMNNAARKVGWLLKGSELAQAKQDTDLQHIDYIWYHGAIEPTSVHAIGDRGGSDHLPVLARFSFN
jgi:endonuclease/exonuclease/phosphatase (EEP) superfamily protein YafD